MPKKHFKDLTLIFNILSVFFRHPVHEHTLTECHQADRKEDSECRPGDAEMFDDLDQVECLEEVAQLV